MESRKSKTYPIVRRQFDPSYNGTPGIEIKGKSMTVPDQTLSVKQLLQNHTRGLPTGATNYEGIYTGDTVAPNFGDMVDRDEWMEKQAARKAEVQEEVDAEVAEAKAAREGQGTQGTLLDTVDSPGSDSSMADNQTSTVKPAKPA